MENRKTRVFISYARKDTLEFADQLAAALVACGFDPDLDREDIGGGEDWRARLTAMLIGADTVVFALSPGSLGSDICKWEVAEAERLSKRIIPIVAHPIGQIAPPGRLSALNYIHMTADPMMPGSGFGSGLARLVAALNTDSEWLREHTRLGELASGWDAKGRPAHRLLTGADILDAKTWMARQPRGAPDPTELTRAFLVDSETAETARMSEERKRLDEMAAAQSARETALKNAEQAQAQRAHAQRRFAFALGGIGVLLLAVIASMIAYDLDTDAREARVFSSLANRASAEGRFELAMRYALAAYKPPGALPWTRDHPDLEARLGGAATMSRFEASFGDGRNPVRSAAISPDGQRIATASQDATVIIWDAHTAAAKTKLEGHRDPVNAVAWSPDGARLITASDDGTARLWDAASGQQLATLPHDDKVLTATFNSDGSRAATATDGTTAHIWDATSGAAIHTLMGHENAVVKAVFSPDGRRLLTASWDQTARVWDVASGTELFALRGHSNSVADATFSANAERIATGSFDGTARIWDARTGAAIAIVRRHTDQVSAVALNAAGNRLLTGSHDMTAGVWDASTGEPIFWPLPHAASITAAGLSTDGLRAVTASSDGTAKLWDTASGQEIAVLRGHTGSIAHATIGPGNNLLTSSADGTARLWTLAGAEAGVLRGHENLVSQVLFMPGGTQAVTAAWDNTVRIWDLKTLRETDALPRAASAVQAIALSSVARFLVTAGGEDEAQIWNLNTKTVTAELRGHTAPVTAIAVSADGTWIVTASKDATARIWDGNGRFIRLLDGHQSELTSVAIAPDQTTIATGSKDGTIRIFDAATATLLKTATPETPGTAEVTGIAFSPNGKSILSGWSDLTARLFDVSTGDLMAPPITGHTQSLTRVGFSPHGDRLLTASLDTTIRLWSLDTSAGGPYGVSLMAELKGHSGGVASAEFSPDGSSILSSSADKTARIWNVQWSTNLRREALRAEACEAKLKGVQHFASHELQDPIARGLKDKNPCERRGPLSLAYYRNALSSLGHYGQRALSIISPASSTSDVPGAHHEGRSSASAGSPNPDSSGRD